jgi:lipopolysaccharide export system protein LptA
MKPVFYWMFLCLSGWTLVSGQDLSMQSTVITSERLEMQGMETRNFFYFRGDVQVKGTNMELACDELTVVALREGPDTAAIGQIGAIEEIVAQGSVQIHQAGRSAYAGRAEVDPRAGTVTLLHNPRIIDGEVEVEGYQFVLHRGEKKFESIPDPNAPKDMPSRSVVRLGAMPDLGFDQSAESISLDERLEEPARPEGEEEAPAALEGVPANDMPEGEGDAGGNP